MGSDISSYILLLVLMALSFYFSASEMAFSTASRVRMKNYAANGNKQAKTVLKILEQYDRALSGVLVGNNVVNIASSSLTTVIFTNLLGDIGPTVSVIVTSVIVLIFCEILPKNIARLNPEAFALKTANILYWYIKIFAPVIAFFGIANKFFAKRNTEDAQPSMTEEELKVMIEEIEDEGVLEQQESELVQSALEFDDISVQEVLTPRVDLAAVEINDAPEHIKDVFMQEGYSRLPVYEKTIDNIVGILHEKEFLIALLKEENICVRNLMKTPLYVPPTKKISALLKELQKNKTHMAVVTDQYGGTMGIITLEDILEELVGEIWDEHDEIVHEITALDNNTYQVNGDMNVHDMFEKIDMPDIGEISSNTVSGWVLDQFDRIPRQGESLETNGLRLTVSKLDDQRVQEVLVQVLPKEEEKPDKEK